MTHSSGVVVSLQTKLVAMTKDFKRVLEVRTENMKESKSRQEKFSHGAITPTNLPIAVTNGYGSIDPKTGMWNGMIRELLEEVCLHLKIAQ